MDKKNRKPVIVDKLRDFERKEREQEGRRFRALPEEQKKEYIEAVFRRLGGFSSLFQAYETYGEKCPFCTFPLLRPHLVDSDGRKRPGACTVCGYYELSKHPEPKTNKALEAQKSKATAYLLNFSIGLSGTRLKQKVFSTYDPTNEESEINKKKAIAMAKQFANGNYLHAIIMGGTGVGKTHLALSIINYATQISNYNMKVMFLSIPLLTEIRYMAIHDDRAADEEIRNIRRQVDRADLVVLDDLGTEKDTDYGKEIIETIIAKREDKALLMTTNLTNDDGSKPLDRYSGRALSRIKNHMTNKEAIVFNNTPDYRVHGNEVMN